LIILGDNGEINLVNLSLDVNSSQLSSYEFLDNNRKSANILRWSPNDKYIAVACDTLIIYEVEEKKMKKIFEFFDHRMEIISLSWNPTSEKIVTSSLDTKIFIRNLKDNSIQNL
jgi:WD40 repeat protein